MDDFGVCVLKSSIEPGSSLLKLNPNYIFLRASSYSFWSIHYWNDNYLFSLFVSALVRIQILQRFDFRLKFGSYIKRKDYEQPLLNSAQN